MSAPTTDRMVTTVVCPTCGDPVEGVANQTIIEVLTAHWCHAPEEWDYSCAACDQTETGFRSPAEATEAMNEHLILDHAGVVRHRIGR